VRRSVPLRGEQHLCASACRCYFQRAEESSQPVRRSNEARDPAKMLISVRYLLATAFTSCQKCCISANAFIQGSMGVGAGLMRELTRRRLTSPSLDPPQAASSPHYACHCKHKPSDKGGGGNSAIFGSTCGPWTRGENPVPPAG
jgi:hypothetical protein